MTYLPTYIFTYYLPTCLPACLPNIYICEGNRGPSRQLLFTYQELLILFTYRPLSLSLSLPRYPSLSLCVCLWGVCFVACALHRGCRCASAPIVAGNPSCFPHSHHIIEESKRDKRERNRNTTVSLSVTF